MISSCESHRYSCHSCRVLFFLPLPTFMIEGNSNLHLDVSEDEMSFFPSKFMEPWILPTDLLAVQEHGWGANNILQTRAPAILSPVISPHHPSACHTRPHRPLAHQTPFSPSGPSPFAFLPGGLCPWIFVQCFFPIVFISVQILYHPLCEGCPDQLHLK